MAFGKAEEEKLHVETLEKLIETSAEGTVFFRGTHGEVRHSIVGAHIDKDEYKLIGHLVLNGIPQAKESQFDALRIRYVPTPKSDLSVIKKLDGRTEQINQHYK